MSTIAEHIQAWREQKLSGTQLMRSIVSHPRWSIPISEAAAVETVASNAVPRIQFNRDPQGVNRLMIWSSAEAVSTWARNAKIETEQHVLETAGTWVFGLPLEGIDEIWIDPLNAHDILYKAAQFPALSDFAAAIAVEKDIADLRAGTGTDGAVIRVREYKKYLLAIAQSPGGNRMILAPDDQGRTLAAIFTTGDTFNEFAPYARSQAKPGEEIVCMRFDGKSVFTAIAGMDITGLVFNCSGPIRPIAFAAGFAKMELDA